MYSSHSFGSWELSSLGFPVGASDAALSPVSLPGVSAFVIFFLVIINCMSFPSVSLSSSLSLSPQLEDCRPNGDSTCGLCRCKGASTSSASPQSNPPSCSSSLTHLSGTFSSGTSSSSNSSPYASCCCHG